jgi:radical SAM superfamily enzyme YgiQ (UPF0313 family)
MSHSELIRTAARLKSNFPSKPIAVLENSQAVTAYSLSHMSSSFFEAGVDFLICGDPYNNWLSIKECFFGNESAYSSVPNIISRYSINGDFRRSKKIDRYPIPAWDLIKLDAYWRLPYSHGPKTAKYLPILTSRGCPYPCDFCVVPETNNRHWLGNDPEDVVQEIIELRNKYGVHDFQVEDLNPTIQHVRWERICELLIQREVDIRFYFVSGTKAETIRIDKISLFAKAGCRYISISPESGSRELMKVIGKKFDQKHAINLVSECRKHKIRTQACFLVGHPQETVEHFYSSKDYLAKLVRAGLDEVAIFVVAPFAGSSLFSLKKISVENTSALPSFSPRGRSSYEVLEARRKALIRVFFAAKIGKGIDIWAQGLRSILGTPETKMENLPRRVAYITWILFKRRLALILRGRNA